MVDQATSLPRFAAGGGQLGGIIDRFDWNRTSLGPVESWPPILRTTVGLILRSPVPIVTLWGTEGVMIYNDAYSGFAGGRHPTLLGSRVREGWPEVADFNDNVMNVVLAGGTLSYEDQELTLHRSGQPEQVWMNLDYSPIVDEHGEAVGVIAIVVETTAKVRAERYLSGERERLRTMFEQAPGFFAQLEGPDHVFQLVNAAYAQIVERDVVGKPVREALPETIAQGLVSLLDDAYRSGKAVRERARALTLSGRDGATRLLYIDFVFQPLKREDGTVFGIVVQGSDVTERQEAERNLARLNASLGQQVAQRTAERDRMWRLSKDILLVAGFDGRVEAVSPAFGALLGWTEAEVVGQNFLGLVHPDDRDQTVARMEGLRHGQYVYKFENRYRRKDGGYCLLSWTASPDESFVHAIGRDITADREQLESMRRTELALQQSQKMETIGKLTGGVAHDFNNLLQIISGNLQLLQMSCGQGGDRGRWIGSARSAVDKGAKLASYLLAFGRRQPLEPKVVRIGRLVAGMEDMLRRALGEEIEVELAMSGSLWTASVDVAQVENAVLNLAINARDAMDGAGKLTIEATNAILDDLYCQSHPEVAPGQYVMLAVTDTGAGMSPEVLRQVFEPFFSTKEEGKGTGLGLSMVYGFVKQSGGHVKIYSEPGQGTTVKIYLPRCVGTEESLGVPVEQQPVVGGTETVLVVEDDAAVRNTAVEMLSQLGYRVLKASDAAAALAVVESGVPIDVLFTDVVMPGTLRSPELARLARARLPRLAVLFTSGYTENAIVHGGRLDPGVELLGKPYTREGLARRIRLVLANQKLRAQAQPEAPAREARALRVVLVEDEDAIRTSTAALLQHLGHHVQEAPDAESALALLSPATDVLITDVQLPGMPGDALAAHARAVNPAVTLVFASGTGEAGNWPDAFVLRKPYDFEALAGLLARCAPPA